MNTHLPIYSISTHLYIQVEINQLIEPIISKSFNNQNSHQRLELMTWMPENLPPKIKMIICDDGMGSELEKIQL